MVELRHSSSIGSRAASSPLKRDDDASPFFPDNHQDDDDDHDRHSSKDRDRPCWYNFQSICFNDDTRFSPHNSRIWLFFGLVLVLAGLIAVFSIVNRLVSILTSRCLHFGNSICIAMLNQFSLSSICVWFIRRCRKERMIGFWNSSEEN